MLSFLKRLFGRKRAEPAPIAPPEKGGIIIVRGLPGSGKSTAAMEFDADVVVSADDFMVDATGAYAFDPARLVEVHALCLGETAGFVTAGLVVAVANTFTTAAELVPYFAVAHAAGVEVEVFDLFDAGLTDAELAERNVHGVTAERIAEMRARYDHNPVETLRRFDLGLKGIDREP